MQRILETITATAVSQSLTTADQFKIEAGISGTDEDALIGRLIQQASAQIAKYCRREFGKATFRERQIIEICQTALVVTVFPVISVTSITVGGVAVSDADYVVDKRHGVIHRMTGQTHNPWMPGIVVVDYEAGYDLPNSPPEDLRAACHAIMRQMRSIAQRDPMVKSIEVPGALIEDYWVGALGNGGLTDDVKSILHRHMKVNV